MATTTIDMKKLGKHDYEYVETFDTKYIFCGTPSVYEDMFYGFAEELAEKFGYDVDKECYNGALPELRDRFIQEFEMVMGAKFIDVCDTY